MELLKALAEIRNPFWDAVIGFITTFGAETVFMIVALVFYWCVDKHRGYYLLFTGFSGMTSIQILKMIFRIPRPWVLDPTFSIVESAREAATGYSFPSGHTQCATDLYGGIARSAKHKWERIVGIVLVILIAFSRLYLGVHTPLDVGVSLLIGGILVFVLYPIIEKTRKNPNFMYAAIGLAFALALGNLLFVELYPFPADVDPVNLEDAVNTAWKLMGAIVGMCVLYPVDQKWIRFETRAVWWAQLIKIGGGVAIILAVRMATKAPLNALLGTAVGSGVRYFLMVLAAGVLWPTTFRFFSKLGRKEKA